MQFFSQRVEKIAEKLKIPEKFLSDFSTATKKLFGRPGSEASIDLSLARPPCSSLPCQRGPGHPGSAPPLLLVPRCRTSAEARGGTWSSWRGAVSSSVPFCFNRWVYEAEANTNEMNGGAYLSIIKCGHVYTLSVTFISKYSNNSQIS